MDKSPTMEEIVEDMKKRIGILLEQWKIKEKYKEHTDEVQNGERRSE